MCSWRCTLRSSAARVFAAVLQAMRLSWRWGNNFLLGKKLRWQNLTDKFVLVPTVSKANLWIPCEFMFVFCFFTWYFRKKERNPPHTHTKKQTTDFCAKTLTSSGSVQLLFCCFINDEMFRWAGFICLTRLISTISRATVSQFRHVSAWCTLVQNRITRITAQRRGTSGTSHTSNRTEGWWYWCSHRTTLHSTWHFLVSVLVKCLLSNFERTMPSFELNQWAFHWHMLAGIEPVRARVSVLPAYECGGMYSRTLFSDDGHPGHAPPVYGTTPPPTYSYDQQPAVVQSWVHFSLNRAVISFWCWKSVHMWWVSLTLNICEHIFNDEYWLSASVRWISFPRAEGRQCTWGWGGGIWHNKKDHTDSQNDLFWNFWCFSFKTHYFSLTFLFVQHDS